MGSKFRWNLYEKDVKITVRYNNNSSSNSEEEQTRVVEFTTGTVGLTDRKLEKQVVSIGVEDLQSSEQAINALIMEGCGAERSSRGWRFLKFNICTWKQRDIRFEIVITPRIIEKPLNFLLNGNNNFGLIEVLAYLKERWKVIGVDGKIYEAGILNDPTYTIKINVGPNVYEALHNVRGDVKVDNSKVKIIAGGKRATIDVAIGSWEKIGNCVLKIGFRKEVTKLVDKNSGILTLAIKGDSEVRQIEGVEAADWRKNGYSVFNWGFDILVKEAIGEGLV